MDVQHVCLNLFKMVDFALANVELAGTHFIVKVQAGWTKIIVDGNSQGGSSNWPVTIMLATSSS